MKPNIREFQAAVLSALAHPMRLKILEKLRAGTCCVCKIVPYVKSEQSNVSHHLQILRRANIVRSEKRGQEVWYEVVDPVIFELLDKARLCVIHNLARRYRLSTTLNIKEME